MTGLTAGYVAGIIAFLMVVVKIIFPTALSFILAGLLKDGETAATWTVAATPLQSSYWATWLGADSSQSHGVRRSVSWLNLSLSLLALLMGITGIVTPLGLYEKDVDDGDAKTPSFVYASDNSAFGVSTSPRKDEPFTRICYHDNCYAPCPYTKSVQVVLEQEYTVKCPESSKDLTTTVPDKLKDIFQSGTSTSSTTVSNFFDIAWRQTTSTSDEKTNGGDPSAAGAFRFLESFALHGEYRAIEGLVVDSKNGGIGFRNHTLPEGNSRGATWSEDLLFLEPDVTCVDNNITVEFEFGASGSVVKLKNVAIVDQGGFVDLNTTSPIKDRHGEVNQPDLHTRAYTAAWVANGLSMFALNVSNPKNEPKKGNDPFMYVNSKKGKKFKVPVPGSDDERFQSMDILTDLGYHLGFYSTTDSTTGDKSLKNPFNVTYDQFTAARSLCEGTGKWMYPQLNNTYVSCTLIRGVPKRIDSGPEMIFDEGSKWSAPLHTCASAVRATIKTATFHQNGTNKHIDNLVVKHIKEKSYPDKKSMPLWGVEKWDFQLGEFDTVWGLLDGAYEKDFEHVSTIRQPWLYLLGANSDNILDESDIMSASSTFMNLPGAIAPINALATIAQIQSASLRQPAADFVAQTSMSLWMKWRDLSAKADTTGDIIKLLWTDLAASAMVGTKGVLGSGNAHPDKAVSISVIPTVHRVMFNYAFAVPAFVTLACLVVVLVLLVIFIARGQASLKIMRQRLKQTSMGRSLTTLFNPESSSFLMTSKDWSTGNGRRVLDLGTGPPMQMEPQSWMGGTAQGRPTPSNTLYHRMDQKTPGSAQSGVLSPSATFEDTIEPVQQYPPLKNERN